VNKAKKDSEINILECPRSRVTESDSNWTVTQCLGVHNCLLYLLGTFMAERREGVTGMSSGVLDLRGGARSGRGEGVRTVGGYRIRSVIMRGK
jgi:hypothetical protein